MLSRLRYWPELFAAFATTIMFVDFLLGLWLPAHVSAIRWFLAVAATLLVAGWLLGRYLRVGLLVHDVHYQFSQHDNWRAWEAAKRRYRYLGISGKTLETEFRRFVSTPHNGLRGCEVQVLLMYPDPALVRESLEHELGRPLNASEVARDVPDLCTRIDVTSRAYQQLVSSGLKIEVRLYKEYCRFWAHLIDDTQVYVAPLLRGSSGLEATVLHLKRGAHDNVLMQFYEDEFTRLWESGATLAQQTAAGR
jgi:hypothetical protein